MFAFFRFSLLPALGGLFGVLPLHADVATHLQSLPRRIPVGDPALTAFDLKEGPKGMAAADFDQNGRQDLAVGNLDGTITSLLSRGPAAGLFKSWATCRGACRTPRK